MEWISVKDRLPNSINEIVLVFINNQIYMGSFRAWESYYLNPDGSKRDYKKTIVFDVCNWLKANHCEECDKESEGGCVNQCFNCCEKDTLEIANLIPTFNISQVTHWMSLPPMPMP